MDDMIAKQRMMRQALLAQKELEYESKQKKLHNLLANIDDAKFMTEDKAVFFINGQRIFEAAKDFRDVQQQANELRNQIESLKDQLGID